MTTPDQVRQARQDYSSIAASYLLERGWKCSAALGLWTHQVHDLPRTLHEAVNVQLEEDRNAGLHNS